MNILGVAPSFQHPTTNSSLLHNSFLRSLAQQHSVTLMVLSQDDVPLEAVCELHRWVRQLVVFNAPALAGSGGAVPARSLGSWSSRVRRSLQFRRAVKRMREAFRELVSRERFDVVLCYGPDAYSLAADFPNVAIVAEAGQAHVAPVRTALSAPEFPIPSGLMENAGGWSWPAHGQADSNPGAAAKVMHAKG